MPEISHGDGSAECRLHAQDGCPKVPKESSMKCVSLILLILAGSANGQALKPVPAINEVDWRSSPLDLNLRGLNGERFRFRCPPGKVSESQVVGSGPYADGSSICPAAVHAGVLSAANGGVVTIEIRPGASGFVGSLAHYVQSVSYDAFWSGTFIVIKS